MEEKLEITIDTLRHLLNKATNITHLITMQELDIKHNILQKGDMIVSDDQNLIYSNHALKVRRNVLSVGWNSIRYIPKKDEVCPLCGNPFFNVHLPDLVEIKEYKTHYHSNCYMINNINEKKNIIKETLEYAFPPFIINHLDFNIKYYSINEVVFNVKNDTFDMEVTFITSDKKDRMKLKILKSDYVKYDYFKSIYQIKEVGNYIILDKEVSLMKECLKTVARNMCKII